MWGTQVLKLQQLLIVCRKIYDAHNLSKIIMYTTRALVMVTTWTMFDWVTRIVNHAISHPETPSWVTSLVTKIREAIQAHHAENTAAKKSTNSTIAKSRAKASLDQAYFSNISQMSNYNFTIPCLQFLPEKINLVIGRIAIDAIQYWLRFPSSEKNTVKCFLIASIELRMLAILYLEPVWKMFQHPYVTVINGPKSNQRQSKPHTRKTLEAFHRQFCHHDLNDPDSKLGKQLGHLNKLISIWSEQVEVQDQKMSKIFPSDSLVCLFIIIICGS